MSGSTGSPALLILILMEIKCDSLGDKSSLPARGRLIHLQMSKLCEIHRCKFLASSLLNARWLGRNLSSFQLDRVVTETLFPILSPLCFSHWVDASWLAFSATRN